MAPIDYSPILLLMPFGFQIAPDTLPSGSRATGSRSALAVSGFRLRARLGFSIPPCFPGQRGITPAFGYGAPHPSAEGTSTPLTHALPSTHYEPLPTPERPACPSRASGWSSLTTPWGFPCCVRFPCVRAAATTPAQRLGVVFAHLTQPCQPSPKTSSGRPAHRPCRGLLGVSR